MFAKVFAIEDAFPFYLKSLRSWLRQRHVGTITVKKRGSPIDVNTLLRQLKGDECRTVFVTKVNGQPYLVLGTEVERRFP